MSERPTTPDDTCWTVIRDAAAGDAAARGRFAEQYAGAVRAYLAARWAAGALRQDVDDAVQDVFLECFRDGGALARGRPERGGFRGFLLGVTRNVARRREERAAASLARGPSGSEPPPSRLEADEPSLAGAFDRRWALAVMAEAGARQRAAARAAAPGDGGAAERRVELLRMRFEDGLAIRQIAERWGFDAARLHHEYARARREFLAALREVVAFHHPGSRAAIDRECAELLALLG